MFPAPVRVTEPRRRFMRRVIIPVLVVTVCMAVVTAHSLGFF